MGNGNSGTRSKIYQRAACFLRAAAWAACLAGCSSTSGVEPGGSVPPQGDAGAGGQGGAHAFGNGGASAAPAAGGSIASAGGSAAASGAGITGSSGENGTTAAGAGGGTNSGGATSSGGTSNHAGAAGTNASGGSLGGAGSSATGGSAGALNLPAVSLYIAGDSTVSEYTLDPKDPKSQAGWGQMLSPNYTSKVKVLDKAVGGRTARRFIQEGALAAILKLIQPGDYLLVQFGTNDSNTTAKYTLDGVEYPYFADAESEFKTYLQQYIAGALDKKAIPVLVTPPPRNSAYCKGARSLANYGQAMLELAKADGISVVDLGLKTHAHLSAICPKPTTAAQELFFKVNADASIDGTHFQENGARIMAGFVADGVDEAQLALRAYRQH